MVDDVICWVIVSNKVCQFQSSVVTIRDDVERFDHCMIRYVLLQATLLRFGDFEIYCYGFYRNTVPAF